METYIALCGMSDESADEYDVYWISNSSDDTEWTSERYDWRKFATIDDAKNAADKATERFNSEGYWYEIDKIKIVKASEFNTHELTKEWLYIINGVTITA